MNPRLGWSGYAASKAGVVNFSLTIIMQPKSVVEMVKYCINSKSDVLEGQPLLIREIK